MGRRAPRRDRPAQSPGARAARQTDPDQPPPFHTTVPAHPLDVILGRPTDSSITLSVVSYADAEGSVSYGNARDHLDRRSKPVPLPAGTPVEVALDGLDGDAETFYRVDRRESGASDVEPGAIHSFHTRRRPGRPFRFTMQADSHLDLNTETALYVRTLEDALAGRPDFHIELGDYYAWEWGDAQYRWLARTLEGSRAPFKLVFIHHLVGGAGRESRGGAEAAAFFEWGGRDPDGTPAFEGHRPGWPRPIHQLLVETGVSAVFHGHDHFYARQEREGIV